MSRTGMHNKCSCYKEISQNINPGPQNKPLRSPTADNINGLESNYTEIQPCIQKSFDENHDRTKPTKKEQKSIELLANIVLQRLAINPNISNLKEYKMPRKIKKVDGDTLKDFNISKSVINSKSVPNPPPEIEIDCDIEQVPATKTIERRNPRKQAHPVKSRSIDEKPSPDTLTYTVDAEFFTEDGNITTRAVNKVINLPELMRNRRDKEEE